MGEYLELIPALAIGAAIGGTGHFIRKGARDRGRDQWLSPVGRPPRDLFASPRVNSFANLIHEWPWIGLLVMLVGFMLLVAQGEIGLILIVTGIGMSLVGAIGAPAILRYAKLAPQYEAEVAAVAAKSDVSLDPA